jgi:hypothetical protein
MILPDGKQISGGAARNKRIAAAGGMDEILSDVFNRATALATQSADRTDNVVPIRKQSRKKTA